MAENGWRALPKRFGNWHMVYLRMNRWAKAGVLDRLFEKLQEERLIPIKIESVGLDRTIVKVFIPFIYFALVIEALRS